MLDDQTAEGTAPLYHFLLCLEEDDMERVLSDRVFAHGREHLECPWELFSVSHVEWPILLEMLVKSIKNSLKVNDFIGIRIGILNR